VVALDNTTVLRSCCLLKVASNLKRRCQQPTQRPTATVNRAVLLPLVMQRRLVQQSVTAKRWYRCAVAVCQWCNLPYRWHRRCDANGNTCCCTSTCYRWLAAASATAHSAAAVHVYYRIEVAQYGIPTKPVCHAVPPREALSTDQLPKRSGIGIETCKYSSK